MWVFLGVLPMTVTVNPPCVAVHPDTGPAGDAEAHLAGCGAVPGGREVCGLCANDDDAASADLFSSSPLLRLLGHRSRLPLHCR